MPSHAKISDHNYENFSRNVSRMPSNRRRIGDVAEGIAGAYLERHGYTILDRNVTFYGGEIDIVARKDGITRCIEVRYREGTEFCHPLDTLTQKKKHLLKRGAIHYMNLKNIPEESIGIGFIAIHRQSSGYRLYCIENLELE